MGDVIPPSSPGGNQDTYSFWERLGDQVLIAAADAFVPSAARELHEYFSDRNDCLPVGDAPTAEVVGVNLLGAFQRHYDALGPNGSGPDQACTAVDTLTALASQQMAAVERRIETEIRSGIGSEPDVGGGGTVEADSTAVMGEAAKSPTTAPKVDQPRDGIDNHRSVIEEARRARSDEQAETELAAENDDAPERPPGDSPVAE